MTDIDVQVTTPPDVKSSTLSLIIDNQSISVELRVE